MRRTIITTLASLTFLAAAGSAVADDGATTDSPTPSGWTPLGPHTPDPQEMGGSFSLQYLQLQQKLQDESRAFNLLANIMETTHEAVGNAIDNIR